MSFKNQRTAYFSLRGLTTHANAPQISGVIRPKFTKFVAVVIFYRRCWRNNTRCDPSTRCGTSGAIFKKVTTVRHKPVGGLAMPGWHKSNTALPNFTKFSVRVTCDSGSTSDDSVIRYVLPVLWMSRVFTWCGQWVKTKHGLMFGRVCQMAASWAKLLTRCVLSSVNKQIWMNDMNKCLRLQACFKMFE